MEGQSMPPPAGTPSGGQPSVVDTPESKKRTRQPRNSACAPCAQLKMKCVRDVEGGKCERCTRMGVECLPAVPKPRKRRESDFFGSQGNAPLKSDAGPPTPAREPRTFPSPATRPPVTPSSTNVPVESLLSKGDLHHTGSKSFTALLSQGLRLDSFQAQSTELLQGIDSNALANAFTVFRQYARQFPFTSIPLRIDAVSMASQRPMTTLAVYAVTSAANRQLQDRMSYTFGLALASKAVIHGERSVDILAGLMIYLAWHHQYMGRQQIYQYLSMLAGMSADLGLYTYPPRSDVTDPAVAAELDRCFIGAYFLCSLVPPYAFNKHSPMRWTENLRVCADNIAQSGELPSDKVLVPLLELAAAVEDMQAALQVTLQSSMPRQHMELQAKAAGQRLRALKRDHSLLANNAILAACSINAQYKQIQYSEHPDPSLMIQCAYSAKEYFDDLLSKPPSFLHQMTLVDWILLLHVAVLMCRLSKQAESATGWEHGALTSMLQPEQTMEKLLNRTASAPSNDPLAPKHDGLLYWLHEFVQKTKTVLLASDSSAGIRSIDGASDGRFRPMNTEAVPLTDRALPYQSQEPSVKAEMYGVLDHGFWRQVANG